MELATIYVFRIWYWKTKHIPFILAIQLKIYYEKIKAFKASKSSMLFFILGMFKQTKMETTRH
jgi:hypothetical protein